MRFVLQDRVSPFVAKTPMIHVAACCALLALILTQGAAAQQFTEGKIFDPALNMQAYDLLVPAGWKYQAVLMPGSSCNKLPMPVFRAYSPDGLTEFRRMPRFDWSWGNAPYGAQQRSDCLPLKHDISAIAFAQHLAQLQKGENFQEVQLSTSFAQMFHTTLDEDNAAIQRQAGVRPFRGDAAAAKFEYQNGSFVIEVQLRVSIRCSHANQPGFGGQQQYFHEDCGADVRVLRAPKGKLDGLISLIDNHKSGAIPNAQWEQAYSKVQQEKLNGMLAQNAVNQQALLAQGENAARVRQQQHQQYMAAEQGHYNQIRENHDAQQGSYDQHNKNVMANMDARHMPASDVVDFALDNQTVTGSNGTVKVPAGYSQVWANQTGQYFETNNLSTNPNGVYEGTWTQQTQVHGNGQPY
jgi:hypothetical protein